MSVLRKLTDYSFILETSTGEQLGIVVDYSAGTTERTGIELFNPDGVFKFDTISELEELLGDTLRIQEKEETNQYVSSKEIDGYPVNDTDLIIDISSDPISGYPTFRKSKRSKKVFIPGWWVVQTSTGNYLTRLTLSLDIYNARKDTEEVFGPFKSFMEANYKLKSL